MTKSEVAFRMSADKLFRENKAIYFWTFTFVEVWEDWVYSRQWARFWRDFCNHSNFFISGLKVTELHENHGIHYHCLLNKRLPVGEIRRLGRRYGVGRVHVKKADVGAVGYLTKYLSKEKSDFSKGIQKWGSVGGFKGVKVSDIVIESDFVQKLQQVKGERRLTWTGYKLVRAEYVREGNISLKTVMDNLYRPNLGKYERMLSESIAMRNEDDDFEDEESSEEMPIIRYVWERDFGVKRSAIWSVRGKDGYEIRDKIEGYAATSDLASRVCDYLNERLKKSYTA